MGTSCELLMPVVNSSEGGASASRQPMPSSVASLPAISGVA